MKKLIFVLAAAGSLVFTSCSSDTNEVDGTEGRIEIPEPDANDPVIDPATEDTVTAGIDSTDVLPEPEVVTQVESTRLK